MGCGPEQDAFGLQPARPYKAGPRRSRTRTQRPGGQKVLVSIPQCRPIPQPRERKGRRCARSPRCRKHRSHGHGHLISFRPRPRPRPRFADDRLAHACSYCRFWLPDRDDQLWAALRAWSVPRPAVAGEWMGPRRVFAGGRDSEPPVGRRSAVRRRSGRPIRGGAGDLHRCGPLRARPRPDGVFDQSEHASTFRRRADRIRPFRLLVQPRHRRAWPAGAGKLAIAGLRRGNGSRLVRTVLVLAARPRAQRCLRLAARPADVLRHHPPHPAAVARFGSAEDR